MVRRWWPDRNPLRRRTDRIEALFAAALFVVFAAVSPASAVAAGRSTYQAGVQMARAAEHAGWRQVSAVLVKDASYPAGAARGLLAIAEAPARWIAPDGTRRSGEILAPLGANAGSRVTTWVDADGRPVPAPLTGTQITEQGVAAGITAATGVAVVLLSAWLLVRRWLDRRRLAAWDAAWRAIAPR